jgi:hypothetical protein
MPTRFFRCSISIFGVFSRCFSSQQRNDSRSLPTPIRPHAGPPTRFPRFPSHYPSHKPQATSH